MFYKTKITDHIRVSPDLFEKPLKNAVIAEVKKAYEGYISKDFGIVIEVADVHEIGEGVIIPGDGAPYYETTFDLYTFKPDQHEVIPGQIREIADFGAFITMGPIEGMIHISQTMNDYVSFSKDKVLQGKDTKRNLKVGDKCKAKVIAVSFKDVTNPKIGLTMRQPQLGKLEWIEEENDKKSGKKVASNDKKAKATKKK